MRLRSKPPKAKPARPVSMPPARPLGSPNLRKTSKQTSASQISEEKVIGAIVFVLIGTCHHVSCTQIECPVQIFA